MNMSQCVPVTYQMFYEHVSPSYARCIMNMSPPYARCTMNMCLHHTPDVLWTCVPITYQMYSEHMPSSHTTRYTTTVCPHHISDEHVLTDLTCDLLHMSLTHATWPHVLTCQTPCTDWPDLTCDLPDLMCWLVRFHILTDLTSHVTYYTCDLPDLMCWLPVLTDLTWPDLTSHVTYLTSCVDFSGLMYWLTWPHMWLTTHVTYLTSCVDF